MRNPLTASTLVLLLVGAAHARPPADRPPPFADIADAVASLEGEVSRLRGEVSRLRAEQTSLASEVRRGFASLSDSVAALGEAIDRLASGPTERRWISPHFDVEGVAPLIRTVAVSVMNPGEEPANVLIKFFRPNGELVFFLSNEMVVAPGGVEMYEVDARVARTRITGWLEVTADVPVLPSGLQLLSGPGRNSAAALHFTPRD